MECWIFAKKVDFRCCHQENTWQLCRQDILIDFTAVIISLCIANPHLVHLKYVKFFIFLKKDPKISRNKAVLNIY